MVVNYNSRYVEEIFVAWRKTMRKLFRLPYRTHKYIVCGITEDIYIKLHNRVTKFMYSMIHSDNETLSKDTISSEILFIFHQNDVKLTNPTEIANAFNMHFANIGKNLATKLERLLLTIVTLHSILLLHV